MPSSINNSLAISAQCMVGKDTVSDVCRPSLGSHPSRFLQPGSLQLSTECVEAILWTHAAEQQKRKRMLAADDAVKRTRWRVIAGRTTV